MIHRFYRISSDSFDNYKIIDCFRDRLANCLTLHLLSKTFDLTVSLSSSVRHMLKADTCTHKDSLLRIFLLWTCFKLGQAPVHNVERHVVQFLLY